MPKSVAVLTYSVFLCLLSVVLLSSFVHAQSDNLRDTTVKTAQRLDDLDKEFHALDVQKRVSSLEIAVTQINTRIDAATSMLRVLVGAVGAEILKRLYSSFISSGKEDKSSST